MNCNHNLPCNGRLLWLSADYGTMTAANKRAQSGEPVATWMDRTGNQRHVSQGTTSRQMIRQDNPVRLLGDGTDDYYELYLSHTFAEISVCGIIDWSDDTTTVPHSVFDVYYSDSERIHFYRSRSGGVIVILRAGGTDYSSGGPVPPGSTTAWFVLRVGPQSDITLSGGRPRFSFNPMPAPLVTTKIGIGMGYIFGNPFWGRMWDLPLHDILIYDRLISDAEIAQFSAYAVALRGAAQ